MPSAKAHPEIAKHAESARIDSAWETIRQQLENERNRVNAEIKNYPTPIPACDAQFNYLLEERVMIAQELDQVKTLALEDPAGRDHLNRIAEFLTSANYVSGEVEQKIRSSLSVLKGGG